MKPHCPSCTCESELSDAALTREIEILCGLEGITLDEARAKWARKRVYTARHRIIAAFRQLHPELKLNDLVVLFERDHSTIVHSCQIAPVAEVTALVERFRKARDPQYREQVELRDGIAEGTGKGEEPRMLATGGWWK